MKLENLYTYITYKFSGDMSTIFVDKTSTAEGYDNTLSDLPETEYRYVVVNLNYENNGPRQENYLYSLVGSLIVINPLGHLVAIEYKEKLSITLLNAQYQ
jgi:hypothetical protein